MKGDPYIHPATKKMLVEAEKLDMMPALRATEDQENARLRDELAQMCPNELIATGVSLAMSADQAERKGNKEMSRVFRLAMRGYQEVTQGLIEIAQATEEA